MFIHFQLYLSAIDKREKSWGPVVFHQFDAKHGYGHAPIRKSAELPDILGKFFELYENENF